MIQALIGSDQVGFVPKREAWDNTIKTILLTNYAQKTKHPLCLLLLDAEKAFDRMDLQFLEARSRLVLHGALYIK